VLGATAMSGLDEARARFERQLSGKAREAYRRRAESSGSPAPEIEPLPDLSALADIEAKLSAYDAWLESRLTHCRTPPAPGQASGEEIPVPSTESEIAIPPLGAPNLDNEAWLFHADDTVENDFDLRRLPQRPGMTQRPVLIETEAEFRKQVEAALGSITWPVRAVPAIYLPERGCVVNGAAIRSTLPPNQNDHAQFQLKALEALALEKWGWGFFLEYTRLGQTLLQNGYWREATARRLRGDLIPRETGPDSVAAILRSSTLTRIGWGMWVRDYLLYKARHPLAQASLLGLPRATKIIEILSIIGHTLENASQVYAIANAIRYILVQTELAPRGAHLAVHTIHDNLATVDGLVFQRWGDSFSTRLAYLIFSSLESKVGMFNMPYALLIAGYVDGQALTDEKSPAEPRQSVDTRLVLLTTLDSRIKYDLAGMSVAAWEEVELDSPREYFRE